MTARQLRSDEIKYRELRSNGNIKPVINVVFFVVFRDATCLKSKGPCVDFSKSVENNLH